MANYSELLTIISPADLLSENTSLATDILQTVDRLRSSLSSTTDIALIIYMAILGKSTLLLLSHQ